MDYTKKDFFFREIYFRGVWDSDLRLEASSGSGRYTGMTHSEKKEEEDRYTHTTETSRDGDTQMRCLPAGGGFLFVHVHVFDTRVTLL